MKYMDMRIYDNGLCDKNSNEYLEFVNSQNLIEIEYHKAKRRLSKLFVEVYEENDNFGDMNLGCLTIEVNKKKKVNVSISMGKGDFCKDYKTFYKDVEEISIQINKMVIIGATYKGNFGTCVYSELYIENGFINHNILLLGNKQINIKCQKIDIEVL